MDFLQCVETRRSVRKFTDEPVTREQLSELARLASYAPSWKNSQTTRYIAVTNKEKKRILAEDCMLGFKLNVSNALAAPCLVVVMTVDHRSGYERDGSPTTDKGDHWQSLDAGIAVQTFCLAAHNMGLGTVVMGIYDEKKVAEVLGAPEGQLVSAILAVGHPAETPAMPKRKTPEDLLSFCE